MNAPSRVCTLAAHIIEFHGIPAENNSWVCLVANPEFGLEVGANEPKFCFEIRDQTHILGLAPMTLITKVIGLGRFRDSTP